MPDLRTVPFDAEARDKSLEWFQDDELRRRERTEDEKTVTPPCVLDD